MKKFSILVSMLCMLVSLTGFFQYNHSQRNQILSFDEVHYAMAAKQGFLINYFEKNSLNIQQFISLGLAKARKTEIDFSTLPDEITDPFVQRHFHPPIPVYFWSFFQVEDPQSTQYNLRISNLILVGLFLFVFILGLQSVTGSNFGLIYTIPIICFFLLSDLFLDSFSRIGFHTWHGLAAIVYLTALINFIREQSISKIIFLSFSFFLLLGTLESALFIILASILALFIARTSHVFTTRNIFLITITTAIFLFIFWPGYFTTGGTLKSIAMYAYRLIFRQGEEYSGISYLDQWLLIFDKNIKLVSIISIIFICFFKFSIKKFNLISYSTNILVIVPLITGLVYATLMTPFLLNSTYIFPAFVCLIFAASCAITILTQQIFTNKINLVVLLTSLFMLSYANWQYGPEIKNLKIEVDHKQQLFKNDLEIIENEINNGKKILADQGHIFKYYLKADTSNITNLDLFCPGFMNRFDYTYKDLTPLIKKNTFDLILIRDGACQNEIFNLGYKQAELNLFRLYRSGGELPQ
jgi:hypothetical protein